MTPDELSGKKNVHVYVASEDPPKNTKDNQRMMDAGELTKERTDLESLAALLVSMESNRFVLTRASNWSRLIDELRKNVVDPR
jgi:acetyl-CoA acetyltransferase